MEVEDQDLGVLHQLEEDMMGRVQDLGESHQQEEDLVRKAMGRDLGQLRPQDAKVEARVRMGDYLRNPPGKFQVTGWTIELRWQRGQRRTGTTQEEGMTAAVNSL